MKTLVFFLEEPSAKVMLEGVLPRVLPDTADVRFIVFQGKQDLEKNLVIKMRNWLLPETVFIVLRDQDAGDCNSIKNNILSLCRQAGKDNVLVRIACRELESFYIGDLHAVEIGLGVSGLARRQNKAKYRTPDALANPSLELSKLTRQAYQKIAGSRAIAPHLDVASNRSHSFTVLIDGLRRCLSETTLPSING